MRNVYRRNHLKHKGFLHFLVRFVTFISILIHAFADKDTFLISLHVYQKFILYFCTNSTHLTEYFLAFASHHDTRGMETLSLCLSVCVCVVASFAAYILNFFDSQTNFLCALPLYSLLQLEEDTAPITVVQALKQKPAGNTEPL